MNSIDGLYEQLRRRLHGAKFRLTRPLHSNGVWTLDVEFRDKKLLVEWSRERAFGISNPTREAFGENPDEVIQDPQQALERVYELLVGNSQPSPQFPVLLSRLRERMGLTQQELARRLGVTQATISGIERRDDVQLSTLRRIVAALGGALDVSAVFPQGRYKIIGGTSDSHVNTDELNAQEWQQDNHAPEGPFPCLKESGRLPEAFMIAARISRERTVLKVP